MMVEMPTDQYENVLEPPTLSPRPVTELCDLHTPDSAMDTDLSTAVCGTICKECEHQAECGGCDQVQGKPFWTAFVGIDICPVYACCTGERHLAHCGECPELPCERFTRYKDPGMNEEEIRTGLEKMKARLLARKK